MARTKVVILGQPSYGMCRNEYQLLSMVNLAIGPRLVAL